MSHLDYSKRRPMRETLSAFIGKEIENNSQVIGKAWPCSILSVQTDSNNKTVPIVTVQFEINSQFPLPKITIPAIGTQHIRTPLRAGAFGIAISADVFIGNVSGLGENFTTMADTGNLAAMFFIPIGNADWKTFDKDSVVLYSIATGAMVMVNQSQVILLSGSSSVTVSPSGIAINGNVTVTGTITATGDITGNGTSLHTHKHGGVQTGGGTTGSPI